MNWNIFDLKHDGRERSAFEELSYFLFCAEFNNKIGLFRFKNQTGIETEPLEKNGVFYGFQAKYYKTPISRNKGDIIDSITKAKGKNSQLNQIYLYLNQELSESNIKGQKRPLYQQEIEKVAEENDIVLKWRVPSNIEIQLSLAENKSIYDRFFTLEPSQEDLLNEVHVHNLNLLKSIQIEIPYGHKKIKIDRSYIVKKILKFSQENKNVIISGEGGCGKTAVLKEFYNLYSQDIPICIFKASELNIKNINDLFQFDNMFSATQFFEAYQDESVKIFVIDSAEKLSDITNQDIFNSLIQKLKETGWNILFTTRYSYLDDLSFLLRENYQLQFDIIDIPLIKLDEIESISNKFDFILPINQKFLERLKNLFYLSEYIKYYLNINKNGNFKSFIDLLWKKRIQNNISQKDNLHIQREYCIIYIARERCKTGNFYIDGTDLPQNALFELRQDEILGYDDSHNGYFITHDIYEEWTLDKIVSRNYFNYSNIKQFFDDLGNSLPIRRAFRLWLSDQLSDMSIEIERFIQSTFTDIEIAQFWKDELLVSILLSDYSATFFRCFESEIIKNDFKILKRILFILRIACIDISSFESIDEIKPKGKGWEESIALIYKYRSSFFEENFKLILPHLTAWCNYIQKGKTARLSGLLALSIIKKIGNEKHFFISKDLEESFLIIVFNSADEIQLELKEIFDKIIENEWAKNRDPYEVLCSKILEKPYLAINLIKLLPLPVIELCDLFWQQQKIEIQDSIFGYKRDSLENMYGIEYQFNSFPPSAYQTPLYFLLKFDFKETLDFIINFTNRAVETYSKSDVGKNSVEEIILHIEGKEIPQYFSGSLWGMYRGLTNAPYLLQSIHMALEEILLEYSHSMDVEIMQKILLYILRNSKTVSLTSIVCSVILANPNEFYDVALILFKTFEFFQVDSDRSIHEDFCLLGLFNQNSIYEQERKSANEAPHRKLNLETLFLKYQIMGIKGLKKENNTEFIEKLYKIIDQYKTDYSQNVIDQENFNILLIARMDRRNLSSKIVNKEEGSLQIEFTPKELPADVREECNTEIEMINDKYKYTFLRLWSDFLNPLEKTNKNKKYEEYDNNPLLALFETKKLVEELKLGRNAIGTFDPSTPAFSCSNLIINYKDKLTDEDKIFCKDIISASLSCLNQDGYEYQLGDGVEAAINAIPDLIIEFPDDRNGFIWIMIFALFDQTSIGNKRLCDYVIESIHKSKMWKLDSKCAQSVLLGYIKLKPYYNDILAKKRKEKGYGYRITNASIIEKLNKINPYSTYKDLSFDIKDIVLFDIHDLEIIYKLIPSDTKNAIHLEIYKNSLSYLASQLLKADKIYKTETKGNSQIYNLRFTYFKKFAYFILQRENNEIDIYLKPFLDNMSSTEETSCFIGELINAEVVLKKYDNFWYIWDCLYPKIIEIGNDTHGYSLKEVIINYLLAWKWWVEGIEEWDSLKKDNLYIYSNISKDLGNVPSVLYSISSVLNSIGYNFKDEGVDWIYTIVINNKSIELGELELNTIILLEKFVRKFVFINKQKIKQDIRLKNKIIPILEFMIERGSTHGYLLRESIL